MANKSKKTKKIKITSKQHSKKRNIKYILPSKISTKSKKFKKHLQTNIRNNLSKYKKGFFKSRKQAIAVSYKQTKNYLKINHN